MVTMFSGLAATRLSGRRFAWMLAAPMVAGIVVFAVYPFIYLLLLSFSDSNLGQVFRDWVGGENYGEALSDAKFTATIVRSVGLALLTTALAMIVGLAVALLLDQAVRGRDLIRTLILLPSA